MAGVVAQNYRSSAAATPYVRIGGGSRGGLGKPQVSAIFRIVHGYKRQLHALLLVSDEFGHQRGEIDYHKMVDLLFVPQHPHSPFRKSGRFASSLEY